jgi:hypothetical protein
VKRERIRPVSSIQRPYSSRWVRRTVELGRYAGRGPARKAWPARCRGSLRGLVVVVRPSAARDLGPDLRRDLGQKMLVLFYLSCSYPGGEPSAIITWVVCC